MTECASLAVGISEDGSRIWATARDADGNTVGTATLTPDCASFSVERSWADGLLTVRIVQEDLQFTAFAEVLTVNGDPARWDLLHSAPFLGERREHSVPYPAEWYGHAVDRGKLSARLTGAGA
jgi:hypothetical protein